MRRLATLSQNPPLPTSGTDLADTKALMLAIYLKRLLWVCFLLVINMPLTVVVPLCRQEEQQVIV